MFCQGALNIYEEGPNNKKQQHRGCNCLCKSDPIQSSTHPWLVVKQPSLGQRPLRLLEMLRDPPVELCAKAVALSFNNGWVAVHRGSCALQQALSFLRGFCTAKWPTKYFSRAASAACDWWWARKRSVASCPTADQISRPPGCAGIKQSMASDEGRCTTP